MSSIEYFFNETDIYIGSNIYINYINYKYILFIYFNIFIIIYYIIYIKKYIFLYNSKQIHKVNNIYLDNIYALWNILLTIYSAYGAYSLIPDIYISLQERGYSHTMCSNDIWYNHYDFLKWYWLSKFVEFIDTLFIMSRGRKLIFLHYYHHSITALYCLIAHVISIESIPNNHVDLCFAALNLFVHTIMYGWYAYSALGYKTSTLVKNMVTIIQTSQMFFGCYFVYTGVFRCKWYNNNYILPTLSALMYSSYVYIFSKLLIFNLKKSIINNLVLT